MDNKVKNMEKEKIEKTEDTPEKDGSEKFYKNKKIFAIVLLIAVIAVGGYYFYTKKSTKDIGQEEAKKVVAQLVNEAFLQGQGTANITGVSEEFGMYKIDFSVGKQAVSAYLTKDGSKFFPQAMDVDKLKKDIADSKNTPAEADKEIPKKDTPQVDLYVMSFCPYGNKAEDTLKSVYALLKDKVTFNFHYIVSTNGNTIQSLHGEKEVTQDEREACVLKQYGKGKWMDFVTYVNTNCGSDGSCWEAGAKSLGIDSTKISTCVTSEGVALMKADEQNSNTAGASGSPTMLINGVTTKAVYQYGNSEAYKQAICGSFNTPPAECSKTLSAETSTTQGGSCGN
jgi:hypothetical protein